MLSNNNLPEKLGYEIFPWKVMLRILGVVSGSVTIYLALRSYSGVKLTLLILVLVIITLIVYLIIIFSRLIKSDKTI